MAACSKTAKLFGFKHRNELVGITDYDLRYEAASYANIFRAENSEVKQTHQSMLVLNVNPYMNEDKQNACST